MFLYLKKHELWSSESRWYLNKRIVSRLSNFNNPEEVASGKNKIKRWFVYNEFVSRSFKWIQQALCWKALMHTNYTNFIFVFMYYKKFIFYSLLYLPNNIYHVLNGGTYLISFLNAKLLSIPKTYYLHKRY